MSIRSFTKEEQALLRENKYTYSVSANTISFTIEFKKEFWKRYQTGQRPRQIVEELGYDFQMLGESRVCGLQSMIKKQALEGNFREGQHTSYAVSNHPDYSSISFTELFDSKTTCKVLSQKTQDKEQAVAGIRNNDIRKNGVSMLTAVTENPHHTKVGRFSFTCLEVNDGAAIVVVDVTVTGASADGTGFKVGLKHSHIGIKKRF